MEIEYKNLIYGGSFSYEKKDKVTGAKTGEKQTSYTLLEQDVQNNKLNILQFYLPGEFPIKVDNLKVLDRINAVIDVPTTGNFRTLINIKAVK